MGESVREIKFRGKRISDGVWLHGDLVHDNIGGCYIYPIESRGLYKQNAVHPCTVGQYTGIVDSDGFEIYEGDILKVNRRYNASYGLGFSHDEIKQLSLKDCIGEIKSSFVTPVVWDKGGFAISEFLDNDTFLCILDVDQRFQFDMFECFVIGNVFENNNPKIK